jgi:group I intron endonuclease
MFSIYFIQSKIEGKVYVGQTKRDESRLREHKYELGKGSHRNPHLQRAWNLIGADGFVFYHVASFNSRQECSEAEKFYIRWFRELGLSYNLTSGGDGQFEHSPESIEKRTRSRNYGPLSEEHKAKIAATHRARGVQPTPEQQARAAEARRGNPSAFLGRHHSEETKRKLSEMRKGENNPQYGKPTSELQKQRASETWKGRKRK